MMDNPKTIAIAILALAVSACSTLTQAEKPADEVSNSAQAPGLKPQNLGEGECGVFLWTETQPRTFVYFQKQDDASAQFYNNDQTRTIQTLDVTSFLADAGIVELDYTGAAGEKIKVKGAFDEEIEGGHRINSASINVNGSDGWQQIIPASGVFVCR